MFSNVEATPLSGKRFVGKRQGISHQITRQTASPLRGCGAVIGQAEGRDPDKGLGIGAMVLQTLHSTSIIYESLSDFKILITYFCLLCSGKKSEQLVVYLYNCFGI